MFVLFFVNAWLCFAFFIAAFFVLNVLQRCCVLLVNSGFVSVMGWGRSLFFGLKNRSWRYLLFFLFLFSLFFCSFIGSILSVCIGVRLSGFASVIFLKRVLIFFVADDFASLRFYRSGGMPDHVLHRHHQPSRWRCFLWQFHEYGCSDLQHVLQ